MNVFGYVWEAVFHCEVPSIEAVHLRIRQFRQICFPTFTSEEDVILSPKNDRGRLSVSQ
jgi:hypothetical protein